MQPIVYYVATSLDGYISGPNDDVSQFRFQGECVEQYQRDLQDFGTVIMGRKTYEFGYAFGLKPGQPAYPNMEHHIFSDSLHFDEAHPSVHVERRDIERVRQLKQQATQPIYLCGGGAFAGWLLDHGLVDVLKLKVNPIVLGAGTPLFGTSDTAANWTMVSTKSYRDGMLLTTYEHAK